ncbi:MAG: formate dehydrogenase subunit gamma [Deltaproteobacteria bacterium]
MRKNATNGDARIRRFHPARIIEHWVHVATFGVLACTGLAQKFYTLDISQWMILLLGGIDRVRLIHRFTGLLCLLGVAVHIGVAIIGIVWKRWQPAMVITKMDFSNLIHNLRYYLGVESLPARDDRYTYKQKFEYWGILTGILLMIGSGLILWFPVLVARILPGELIPTAKVLHTNEAMVILLIISIWHIYNALFSPEVFPLDTSIFTGTLPRERMLKEHRLELAALEGRPVEELESDQTVKEKNLPAMPGALEKNENV